MKEQYTILVIPDTQEITRLHEDILTNMYNKIILNHEKWNVKMILHLGDVVNDGSKDEHQFTINKEGFNQFSENDIPYLISIGNHDYDNLISLNRDALMFNKYFGLNEYKNKPYFGGSYNETSENIYLKLTLGKTKYLFLALEFGPSDEVVSWANQVIEKHLDYKVVVVIHSHLHLNGNHDNETVRHNPKSYPGLTKPNNGDDMWAKCFKKHQNIWLVVSGHYVGKNISYLYGLGDQGNLVFQIFQNWQYETLGGMGRFLLYTVNEKENKVTIQTFNPYTNTFEHHDGYDQEIPLNPTTEDINQLKNKTFKEKDRI